jgi:LPS-assembly protein
MNVASYRTDTPMGDGISTSAHRVIPTLSADAGLRFDRDTSLFGYKLRQTLEPRLHYVNTPWRDQTNLPLFDTAASDFNAVSIYADNPFSGVDRVADAHQLTIGATTRWLEPASGVERLRLGAAQRFLFRDARLTPEDTPSDQRVSDLILFGSGSLWQDWIFDATVQYGAGIGKPVRSIVSVRYQPAPFHTLSGTYRYARDLNEQFELGWQWPLYRGEAKPGGGACQGTLYGVGRVNYSMRDSRVTDALAGFEYDAGCWIARIVYQRDSTGLQESTTHWMLQLELVGLSRLGSNPLKALKDNIPGYRLLRDDDAASPSTTTSP